MAEQTLAEQYPPEDGPFWVEDEGTGHKYTVAVVKPGLKVLAQGDEARDENGRFRKTELAEPKTAKKAAAGGSKES